MNGNVLFRKALIKGQFFLQDPGDKAAAASIEAGYRLTLLPEPENTADPMAVVALHSGRKVGYVQAEISAALRWFMLNEFAVECLVVERGKSGNLVVNISVIAP